MIVWSPEQDDRLRELHGTMSIPAVADALGVTRGAVRARVTKLRLAKRNDWFSELEAAEIAAAYADANLNSDLRLDDLAARLGRSKQTICRKAAKMGLTNIARPYVLARKTRRKYASSEEARAAISAAARERLASGAHPRGMAGKHHSAETKDKLRSSSLAFRATLSVSDARAMAAKAMRTRADNGGSPPKVQRGSWKAGWREIGGKRNYYRSRWEANYARYLEWLRVRGDIADWKHEPETFWFEAIKRGVRSYLPDFRVWDTLGNSQLHEVKGWMDARSKTTLKRMAKYHPGETIVLIREAGYNAIARSAGRLIPDWECSDRSGRW